MKCPSPSVFFLSCVIAAPQALAVNVDDLYSQTGTDPTWQELMDANALPIGVNSTGGVQGSEIDVVNSLVEVGPNANNPIMNGLRLHTVGNSVIFPGSFDKWSRWYQEDGNTQVFRLFKDEENVRNDRPAAARIEAYDAGLEWQEGDGWQKWQATYTIIKPLSSTIFQAKNRVNDWSVTINMTNKGNVYLNRRRGEDVLIAQDMVGKPFDITVYDNGLDYQVFLNDAFQGSGQFSRPEGTSRFRWGMYVGGNIPSSDGMLFVTGAKSTAGATPPARPGELLVAWDTWASGSEAATLSNRGATGYATESGDWRENNQAASNDGSFGSLISGASTAGSAAGSGTHIGTTGDGAYDFTITAGDNALSLASFHFDAQRKRTKSPDQWKLEVVAGQITLATIASGDLGSALGGSGPSNHNDYDLDLSFLADHVLDAGESATFRLSFTGGDAYNPDQQTYLDNVAITGHLIAIPGDTDGDSDIDDSDLGTAFSNYTGPLAPGTGSKTAAQGDADGDGDVDDSDLGTLFAAYTGPTAPINIPEPASVVLLALGGLAVFRRRRR